MMFAASASIADVRKMLLAPPYLERDTQYVRCAYCCGIGPLEASRDPEGGPAAYWCFEYHTDDCPMGQYSGRRVRFPAAGGL